MKSYSLTEIPDELWAEYKDTIPKSKRIEDDIVDLIRDAVERRKNE